jgi:cytochrome c
LVDQNRGFGSSRGAKTVLARVSIASVAPKNVVNSEKPVTPILKSTDISATLNKYACLACHGIDTKLVGPSFKEIVSKQAGRADATVYLAGKIKNGSSGVYGSIPMPAQNLSEGELSDVVKWIVSGAAK